MVEFPRGNRDFYLELVDKTVTGVCKGRSIEICDLKRYEILTFISVPRVTSRERHLLTNVLPTLLFSY